MVSKITGAGKSICVALAAALAAGCSSGGGGSYSGSSGDSLLEAVSRIITVSVSPDWALSSINAASAHSKGHTGKGITIGMVDTGVDVNHWKFRGRIANPASALDAGLVPSVTISHSSHGTAVAGVIVANSLAVPASVSSEIAGNDMVGVAPDAQIHVYPTPLSPAPPRSRPYAPADPKNISPFQDLYYENRFGRINRHVSIVNNSFGFSGLITEPIYSSIALTTALGRTIKTIAQENVNDADKVIYVWAAGNNNRRPVTPSTRLDAVAPNLLAGMPYHVTHLTINSLAVVAVDPNGRISWFSNRCGVAAHFCIAAPGNRVWAPSSSHDGKGNISRGYSQTAGTSIAAPHVSGALAVLMSAFPSMGSTEIMRRMLATANKTGIYAEATVYGQGLLDLDAALKKPVGNISLLSEPQLEGKRFPAGDSRLRAAAAFGDALSESMRGVSITAYDNLDTPFILDLGSFASKAMPRARIAKRLSALLAAPDPPRMQKKTRLALNEELIAIAGTGPGGWFGLNSRSGGWAPPAAQALELPHLLLSDGKAVGGGIEKILDRQHSIKAAAFLASGDDSQAPSDAALVLEYGSLATEHKQEGIWMLQAGLLDEAERLLGGDAQGAFGSIGARTLFAGAQMQQRLAGGWRAHASFHAGISRPQLNAGMLRRISATTTSSWALGIGTDQLLRAGDSLILTANQPLRTESGQALLEISAGRTRYRQVLSQNIEIDLRPSGRQVDLALAYTVPIGSLGRLQTVAGLSRHPGHSRAAGRDYFLLLAANFRM